MSLFCHTTTHGRIDRPGTGGPGSTREGRQGTERVCAADGHRCSERQGNGSSRNPHRNVAFLPHDDARAHRQAGHGRAGFDSGRQAGHGTGMRGRRAPLLGSLPGRYRAREAACMSPLRAGPPRPTPTPRTPIGALRDARPPTKPETVSGPAPGLRNPRDTPPNGYVREAACTPPYGADVPRPHPTCPIEPYGTLRTGLATKRTGKAEAVSPQ